MTTTSRRDALMLAAACVLPLRDAGGRPHADAKRAAGPQQEIASRPEPGPVYRPEPIPGIEPSGPIMPAYTAACVRGRVQPVFSASGAFMPQMLDTNVENLCAWIARCSSEAKAKLLLFCEFCLQMARQPASVSQWLAAAIEVPGPVTDQIGKAAQAAGAYVGLTVIERIAVFPGRYFLSGIVIAPNGDIVLNARKLYDISNKTRPTDVLTAWLDKFGPDSLFPVVDTPLGRLGCVVAADVTWPEAVRNLAFKGAEVLLNPTASPAASPTADALRAGAPDIRALVRRVRAYENQAYLLQSNLGPVGGDGAAVAMMHSEIISFGGELLAASCNDNDGFISASLDINALRRARTSMTQNWLAQTQLAAHLPGYTQARFTPSDGFAVAPLVSAAEQLQQLSQAVQDLIARGVLQAPGAAAAPPR